MAEEEIEKLLKKIPKEKLIKYLRETVEKHSALLTFTFLSIKEGYDAEDEDVQQIRKVLSSLSLDSDLLTEERKKITEILGFEFMNWKILDYNYEETVH